MPKNKLERYARIYTGGYDLSGDARSLGSLDNLSDEVDMTGWANAIKNYLAGQRTVGVRDFKALLNDNAGSFDALADEDLLDVSLFFGSGAEPVVGDVAYILAGAKMAEAEGFEGGAGAITASFLAASGEENGNPFGVVLYPKTAVSSTATGASVNNGAASTGGWHANLHITAVSSGVFSFAIEHSTDGTTWANLSTFTLTGNAIGSEHISGTGTANRYVRFKATRTSGSATVAVAFARN